MTVRLLYRLRGGMEDDEALDVFEQPEDWTKVMRLSDEFIYPDRTPVPMFMGERVYSEKTEVILKRNQPKVRWVLPGPDDHSECVFAVVMLGDGMHEVLIHPNASMQQVADAFGIGEVRGFRVEPEKAFRLGYWHRPASWEKVTVWIIGSKPENWCWLDVKVNERKYVVQVQRQDTLAQLIAKVEERGRVRLATITTRAFMMTGLNYGAWPDNGQVDIVLKPPWEELTIWAWGPRFRDQYGELRSVAPDILMKGKLKHSEGRSLAKKGVTYESRVEVDGEKICEVEGGTFTDWKKVGVWKTVKDPAAELVWMSVYQKGERTDMWVTRGEGEAILTRVRDPVEQPREWKRDMKEPPKDRGWRWGDSVRVWSTAPDVPISTHVRVDHETKALTIYRNTTHAELARLWGCEPGDIYRWNDDPPWTEESTYISAQSKRARPEEIRRGEEGIREEE
jgi:hypothetical protein